MNILIKGMEMPKGLPVCIVIDATGQARRYDLNNDRYADDALFEAVSVPPHGDLIDRDVLERDAQKRLLMCNKNDNHFQKPYEVMRAIALAPTIIPATK